MPLPTSTRKKDVFERLEYAERRRNEFMTHLFEAETGSHSASYIVQAASDIIATGREVFDYLGLDIFEQYILPTAKQKIQKGYAAGSLRVYFPFYVGQVEQPNAIWQDLKTSYRDLYEDLRLFGTRAANKEFLPNTRFDVRWFQEMQEMVNEKKHNRLLSSLVKEDHQTIVTTQGSTVVFNNDDMQDVSDVTVTNSGIQINIGSPKQIPEVNSKPKFTLAGNGTIESGRAYYFASNQRSVGNFCLHAVKGTELVMREFYAKYFAP